MLESSTVERDLGVVVVGKLNISPLCGLLELGRRETVLQGNLGNVLHPEVSVLL